MKILSKLALIAMLCAVIDLGCRKSGPGAHDGTVATLPELNRALSVRIMGGRMPQDVFELTNSAVLEGKRLPVAPPGKKLVIDPATRQVVFADQ